MAKQRKNWIDIPNIIGKGFIPESQLDECLEALSHFGEEGFSVNPYRSYEGPNNWYDYEGLFNNCDKCDGLYCDCCFEYLAYEHLMSHKIFKKHKYD